MAAVSLLASCGRSDEPPTDTVKEITVAAASDLRPAFEALGALFTERTGTTVTFSFGSSGQLKEQIINGAPFDMFASANVAFVDEVIDAGRGVADTKADYALGRIVLWSPPGVERPTDVKQLSSPDYQRIAIANPAHAPYGVAAEQAIDAAGISPDVASRLVFGENVSDTMRIAKSGNASVAIVALSLAIADGSEYTLIPDSMHKPLEQALVVTGSGARGERATEFAEFISSKEGREIMNRFGFVLPGETAPSQTP